VVQSQSARDILHELSTMRRATQDQSIKFQR
jgi:hypothetical protein